MLRSKSNCDITAATESRFLLFPFLFVVSLFSFYSYSLVHCKTIPISVICPSSFFFSPFVRFGLRPAFFFCVFSSLDLLFPMVECNTEVYRYIVLTLVDYKLGMGTVYSRLRRTASFLIFNFFPFWWFFRGRPWFEDYADCKEKRWRWSFAWEKLGRIAVLREKKRICRPVGPSTDMTTLPPSFVLTLR